jgi:hypothetical protein
VFAGSGPLGGLFAGAVAEVLGPPAGFILGSILAALVLALATWQLTRRREAYGPGSLPADATAVTPPRT